MSRGKFITFEGIDGAGKSSHLEFVCELARSRGGDPERTYEPGGTPFGDRIREVVLGQRTTPLAETLAMFAARRALVEGLIEPTLAAGRWVVCDRFTDSTYAYQCGGNGVAREHVAALERMVHPGLRPDATFLFDLDPVTAAGRQAAQGRKPDRFESEKLDFHVRVRDAYLERVAAEPRRFHVIDASRPFDEVREAVRCAFTKAFP